MSLKSFFNTQNDPTELDRENVANLIALETNIELNIPKTTDGQTMATDTTPNDLNPDNSILESQTKNGGCKLVTSYNNWRIFLKKIKKTKERERLIFSEPNPVENCSILGENDTVDQNKLFIERSIQRHMAHKKVIKSPVF